MKNFLSMLACALFWLLHVAGAKKLQLLQKNHDNALQQRQLEQHQSNYLRRATQEKTLKSLLTLQMDKKGGMKTKGGRKKGGMKIKRKEPKDKGPPITPPADPPVELPMDPPVTEFIEVRLGEFFMSYVSASTEEPTQDAYNQLVSATEQWFGEVYTDHFANTADLEFVDLQLVPGKTQHNAGLPEPRFNIYMGYEDGILRFTGTSKNIPEPLDLYVIYISAISASYLLDVVRALEGTPFAQVTEVITDRPAQP